MGSHENAGTEENCIGGSSRQVDTPEGDHKAALASDEWSNPHGGSCEEY